MRLAAGVAAAALLMAAQANAAPYTYVRDLALDGQVSIGVDPGAYGSQEVDRLTARAFEMFCAHDADMTCSDEGVYFISFVGKQDRSCTIEVEGRRIEKAARHGDIAAFKRFACRPGAPKLSLVLEAPVRPYDPNEVGAVISWDESLTHGPSRTPEDAPIPVEVWSAQEPQK